MVARPSNTACPRILPATQARKGAKNSSFSGILEQKRNFSQPSHFKFSAMNGQIEDELTITE